MATAQVGTEAGGVGHALFGLGFLLVGTVWYIAAFRLARPDSFWARKVYGDRKMERARKRYGLEVESSD